MESMAKIRELNDKIQELQLLIEDFINLHNAKKSKIGNLESEIKEIKHNMNKYIDDLQEIVDQK